MEVIARKKRKLCGRDLIVAVLGGLCFAGSLIGVALGDHIFIFPSVLALSITAVGICMLVSIKKTPDEIITYDGKKLYFADGLECSPREISNVNYKQSTSMLPHSNLQYSWGSLTVTVNAVEHTYANTADVIDVHDRLLELMLQSREKNNG